MILFSPQRYEANDSRYSGKALPIKDTVKCFISKQKVESLCQSPLKAFSTTDTPQPRTHYLWLSLASSLACRTVFISHETNCHAWS